jgi:uncharacterized protein (DUF433 family)
MSTQIQLTLTQSPEICGGRLRIEGTRVTVNQIAWLYKQGEPPEEIAAHFPQLHLAQIYAALAHYHANREEVEKALDVERHEAERLRSEFPQP